jgi:hypothetical protein
MQQHEWLAVAELLIPRLDLAKLHDTSHRVTLLVGTDSSSC